MWAGPPTMSHIDSANQEVCAQLLRLCYTVNTLRRVPTYVHSMFTLHSFYLAATVSICIVIGSQPTLESVRSSDMCMCVYCHALH